MVGKPPPAPPIHPPSSQVGCIVAQQQRVQLLLEAHGDGGQAAVGAGDGPAWVHGGEVLGPLLGPVQEDALLAAVTM